VPYRNHQGHIQGLQVRRDNGDPRYIWVSSANNNGTSPGSPIHFAKPWIADLTQFAIITEGALKGDSIAEYLEQTVIAIAGVSSFSEFIGERLHQELPNLKTLAIAFDNDWRTKPQVKDQLLRLIEILEKDRFQVKVLDWKEAKGLDDLLRLAESEEK
jgi:hypothetical protein